MALFLADYRMPQMTGIEFLARAMRRFPGCQTRPAHRVCGYRGRHPRHQRNQAGSLSAEAVGSAGAEPLSRAGRSAGRLAGDPTGRPLKGCGFWARAGRRAPTNCANFWRATRCPTVAGCGGRGQRSGSAPRAGLAAPEERHFPWSCSRMAPACPTRRSRCGRPHRLARRAPAPSPTI